MIVDRQRVQRGPHQERLAVDWEQDSRAAALALRTTPYGLPLLDLGLPGRGGLMVLKGLRQRDDNVQALISTALTASALRLDPVQHRV
jgi:DNA-binding response OmpR family regulator